jgi:hypothetical protein
VLEADVPTERDVVRVGVDVDVADAVVEELTDGSVGVAVGVGEVEAVKAMGAAESVAVEEIVLDAVEDLVVEYDMDADAVAVEDHVAEGLGDGAIQLEATKPRNCFPGSAVASVRNEST